MERFRQMSFGKVYPLYVNKVKRKGQSHDDLDTVIQWLTGYSTDEINQLAETGVTFEDFFAAATLHPNACRLGPSKPNIIILLRIER